MSAKTSEEVSNFKIVIELIDNVDSDGDPDPYEPDQMHPALRAFIGRPNIRLPPKAIQRQLLDRDNPPQHIWPAHHITSSGDRNSGECHELRRPEAPCIARGKK